jgi:hypothetical protein
MSNPTPPPEEPSEEELFTEFHFKELVQMLRENGWLGKGEPQTLDLPFPDVDDPQIITTAKFILLSSGNYLLYFISDSGAWENYPYFLFFTEDGWSLFDYKNEQDNFVDIGDLITDAPSGFTRNDLIRLMGGDPEA